MREESFSRGKKEREDKDEWGRKEEPREEITVTAMVGGNSSKDMEYYSKGNWNSSNKHGYMELNNVSKTYHSSFLVLDMQNFKFIMSRQWF